MATRTLLREQLAPPRHRTWSEFAFEVAHQNLPGVTGRGRIGGVAPVVACGSEVRSVRLLRDKEVDDVVEAILDRAKTRAVSSTRSDRQWCLPVKPLRRIELAKIREVIYP